jgi:hypothetical protein
MFFYAGNSCPIKSLDQKSENLYLDKGWQYYKGKYDTYWYKGYSTECSLEHSIEKIIDGYKPAGKWAIISSAGIIYFPLLRGFPLYSNGIDYTNMPLPEYEYVGYDTPSLKIGEQITITEASKKINDILKENVINFFKYNNFNKLHVLYSAGIDSLTVWSIVDSLEYDYDLYIHKPKPKDIFGVKQEYESDLIDLCRKKFWGYKMTSCYSNPNVYLTGFYSERMQLREVSQGHVIANYKQGTLSKLPKKTDYLYGFLQRPENKINNYPVFDNLYQVMDWCNTSVFHDNQMWHIDNNYHFSPFYDIRITQVVNQLSLDDIIQNALTAIIQKNIIQSNRPDFISLLSDYKNEGNIWANFNKNFDKIYLRPEITKYIT